MALSNSATDEWLDFDIDKCIVVEDFETEVYGTYDLIRDDDYSIERMSGHVPIPHTDGCGMILPNAFGRKQRNKMLRAPWVKGLLGVFDFVGLIEERGWSPVIKDIYGQEHDVVADDIQVVLTKSQFKLWKYYDDFEQYKSYFKEYNCTAGFCNVEEVRIKKANINYQMLQTLTDVTDEELLRIAQPSVDRLEKLCSSIDTIKAVFGVTPYNYNMTPLQQAIKMYPDLINDEYFKGILREIKDSLVKQYKAGRLEIDGKYTFILPDLYAACEWWFGHIENPPGILNGEDVYCRLFKNREKLDCLRSPHLFKEHAVRHNVAYDEWQSGEQTIGNYFTTNALYTSSHDMISRILQFDDHERRTRWKHRDIKLSEPRHLGCVLHDVVTAGNGGQVAC